MMRPTECDRELIDAVICGDPVAAEEFVDRYERLVYSVLVRDLRLPADVSEEIFVEVFAHLWEDNYRRLRQWRGQGRFSTYLVVIVHNKARDFLRKNPLPAGEPTDEERQSDDPPDEGAGAVDQLLAGELGQAVRKTLECLSPRDCELIERKHFREESYAEIAAAMGLTVNQVGVYLSRAEARLRKALTSRHPGLFATEEVVDDDV